MDKYIAHRGNLFGPSVRENTMLAIVESIKRGFDVEIDVRIINGEIFLGHDRALWKISFVFLKTLCDKLWVHVKNEEGLEFFSEHSCFNYFWHEDDKYTITSHGYIWCYPNHVVKKGIVVLPENNVFEGWNRGAGICSDYIVFYKKMWELEQQGKL